MISIEHEGNLYYPNIFSADMISTFPYTIPSANITCSVMDHIKTDDIIRIDDLFHGRIINISINNEEMTLDCAGHASELDFTYITTEYDGSGLTSGSILEHLISTYCNRILPGTFQGNIIHDFEMSANKRTVYDSLKQIENLDKDFRLSLAVDYNNGTLNTVTANWKALPSTTSYQAMYKSKNVIDYYFESLSNNLFNKIEVFGNTVEDPTAGTTTQYKGAAEDTYSQGLYGTRQFFTFDGSLDNDEICYYVAHGLIDKFSMPMITGTITLLGSYIKPGDLINLDFPVIIEGQKIKGLYRVSLVSHSLFPWTTTINIGPLSISPGDMMQTLINRQRLENLNSVI